MRCATRFLIAVWLIVGIHRSWAGEPQRVTESGNITKVGSVVKGTTETGLSFCVVSLVASKHSGSVVEPGLYVSKDRGASWQAICSTFDFRGPFYVHPLTGRLYAAIYDRWLTTNGAGYVIAAEGFKILMSTDGKMWSDLTGPQGHLASIMSIFQDPDRPGRVCVEVSTGLRSYVLQSIDDHYSKWVWHDELKDGKSFRVPKDTQRTPDVKGTRKDASDDEGSTEKVIEDSN